MGSEWKWIHQPAEDDGGGHEAAEHHRAGPELLAALVLQEGREDDRHEQRVRDHEQEVARGNGGHYFRPCVMSNASSMTRKLSSPDVMRNVLPYSYEAAVTVPAPASAIRASRYGRPTPRSAIAPRKTSGSDNSKGKRRPCSVRPTPNMSGSVTRNTSPLSRLPCIRCPAPGTSHASTHTSAIRQGSAAARGRSAVVDFEAMPIATFYLTAPMHRVRGCIERATPQQLPEAALTRSARRSRMRRDRRIPGST